MPDRTEIVPLLVRLPKELHQELVSMARDEQRSLNFMVVESVKEKVRGRHSYRVICERPAPYDPD